MTEVRNLSSMTPGLPALAPALTCMTLALSAVASALTRLATSRTGAERFGLERSCAGERDRPLCGTECERLRFELERSSERDGPRRRATRRHGERERLRLEKERCPDELDHLPGAGVSSCIDNSVAAESCECERTEGVLLTSCCDNFVTTESWDSASESTCDFRVGV